MVRKIIGSIWDRENRNAINKNFEELFKSSKGANRGELPLGTNVYDMRGKEWEGIWNISGASTSQTILGEVPPGMIEWQPGQIFVLGSGGGTPNLSSIFYTPYSGSRPRVFYTTINNYKATGKDAWFEWVDLADKSGGNSSDVYSGHYGTPNIVRIEDFKQDYPLVSTGNKGAVMFRYDHNLTSFKQKVKPLHDSLNFPYCIAMNSRTWDDPSNSGASQSDVKQWIADGLCEVWNHTATHVDTDKAEELFDIIVNGRIELEQQLDTKIHGFIVPGMAPTGMGGFGGGASYDVFSKTYAGSLIQAYHAVSSGSFSGTSHRKLDGKIKLGQAHYTIEKRTVASIKAHIDSAITNKTALQLMLHPHTLDMSGYLSTAKLTEVLDYVKSKVDAGQLVVLSPYQSLHAEL